MASSQPFTTAAGLRKAARAAAFRAVQALSSTALPEDVVCLQPPTLRSAGDLCMPCFALSKPLGKKPVEIAATLAASLSTADDATALMKSITAAGPFVNVQFRDDVLAAAAIGEFVSTDAAVRSDGLWTPSERRATGKHVVVEFSSPNTNKPQHLGHLRNNFIGDAVQRLLRFCGDQVTAVNLVNDRGIHICKSMLAYKLFGDPAENPDKTGEKGDHFVGRFYVEFEKRFQAEYAAWLDGDVGKSTFGEWRDGKKGQDALKAQQKMLQKKSKSKGKAPAELPEIDLFPIFKSEFKDTYFNSLSSLGAQASEMLVRWEKGDEAVRSLWLTMNTWVRKGFAQTYESLGISFNHIDLESETYQLGKKIVEKGLADGKLQKSKFGDFNNCVVADLDALGVKNGGLKVLLRSNGTSVYMTQDLGTAEMRIKRHSPTELVYVVADEQDRHFDILFHLLRHLDETAAGIKLTHLSYGMVNLPDGRMKSREGTVVDADDLVAKLVEMARDEIKKRAKPDDADTVDGTETRAKAIALSAIKFFLLVSSPKTTMTFNPQASMDFSGKTGPYMLYSYARIQSILREVNLDVAYSPAGLALLFTTAEEDQKPAVREVLNHLSNWGDVVLSAAAAKDPSRVALATYEVSQAFSTWYQDRRNNVARCEDAELKMSRALLVMAVGACIRAGMSILGIDVVEKM